MWVNVKTAFGAVGNGSTDDRVALQAAFDSGWNLYFPPGNYKINDSLKIKKSMAIRGAMVFRAQGDIGSQIVGNFNKPLIHTNDIYLTHDNTWVQVGEVIPMLCFTAEHMGFVNDHQQGCCVQISFGVAPCTFNQCSFNASYRGLMFLSCFGAQANHCYFSAPRPHLDALVNAGASVYEQAVALYLGQHCTAIGCDFQSVGTGIYATGLQNIILSARMEVCGYGMILGGPRWDPVNHLSGGPLSRSIVSGISMESNKRGVWFRAIGSAEVSNIGMQAGTNAPPSDGDRVPDWCFLFEADAGGGTHYNNVLGGGVCRHAAIIYRGRARNVIVTGSTTDPRPHVGGTNTLYSQPPGSGQIAFHHLEKMPHVPSITAKQPANFQTITSFSDLQLVGLKGLNVRDPNVLPRNLGGIVAVAQAATTQAVLFPVGASHSNGQFSGGVTAQNNANSTLAAGTYHYACTLISTRGETGVPHDQLKDVVYRSVTVSSGQHVRATWFPVPDSVKPHVKRRLYRGPAQLGVFEGFWEIDSSLNEFIDDGTVDLTTGGFSSPPFTGRDIPPPNDWLAPSRVEHDANYAVVVTPSWGTTAWVTAKATTGFTINFGTPAPEGATVQWLLFRP